MVVFHHQTAVCFFLGHFRLRWSLESCSNLIGPYRKWGERGVEGTVDCARGKKPISSLYVGVILVADASSLLLVHGRITRQTDKGNSKKTKKKEAWVCQDLSGLLQAWEEKILASIWAGFWLASHYLSLFLGVVCASVQNLGCYHDHRQAWRAPRHPIQFY